MMEQPTGQSDTHVVNGQHAITKKMAKYLATRLHHKRLTKSSGAIAGFISAISVAVGVLAARSTPHGLSKVTMALHMTSKPLLVKLAPVITGVAVAAAAAAGLIRFYSWCLETEDEEIEAAADD